MVIRINYKPKSLYPIHTLSRDGNLWNIGPLFATTKGDKISTKELSQIYNLFGAHVFPNQCGRTEDEASCETTFKETVGP